MIHRNTLDGLINIENNAIELLKEHEPKEGYYVAFSGGKDSIVTLDLVKKSGVKYDAHFHFTTVDPPELIEYIRKYYPDIPWDRPKESMFQLILKKGFPPTRQIRYCCSKLKETGGKNRTVVTGIRWQESHNRGQRKPFEKSPNSNVHYLHPIISWSEKEVWKYIHQYEMPYCNLYDEGYKRIGCIMCPLQNTRGIIRDAERYPKFYKAYYRVFEKCLIKNKGTALESKNHKSAEDIMNFWIYGTVNPKFIEILKNKTLDEYGCGDIIYEGLPIEGAKV